MMAASSRDWNVFKQIFADHWEPFQQAHPRYRTAYYESLVAKMLACGNPEKIGYTEYRCLHCGQGKHLVAMSCKSSLCLRCAKVSVDNWVSQVSRVLHEGVIYRHIILKWQTTVSIESTVSTSIRSSHSPRGHSLRLAGSPSAAWKPVSLRTISRPSTCRMSH
jgi:Transposase zinc-binding domain